MSVVLSPSPPVSSSLYLSKVSLSNIFDVGSSGFASPSTPPSFSFVLFCGSAAFSPASPCFCLSESYLSLAIGIYLPVSSYLNFCASSFSSSPFLTK